MSGVEMPRGIQGLCTPNVAPNSEPGRADGRKVNKPSLAVLLRCPMLYEGT